MLSPYLNRLRISTRLFAAFGSIILLVGVLGAFALRDIVELSTLTNRLVDHPLRVIDLSQQALNSMALIQRDLLAIIGRDRDFDRAALPRDIEVLDRQLDAPLVTL